MHTPSAPTPSLSQWPYGNWHPSDYTLVFAFIQSISIIQLKHWPEASEKLLVTPVCGDAYPIGADAYSSPLPCGNWNLTAYTPSFAKSIDWFNNALITLVGSLRKNHVVTLLCGDAYSVGADAYAVPWPYRNWYPSDYTPSFKTIPLISIIQLKHWLEASEKSCRYLVCRDAYSISADAYAEPMAYEHRSLSDYTPSFWNHSINFHNRMRKLTGGLRKMM